MKCGSCRDTEAASYRKIKQDDNLFDVLKYLNPNQVYNPKYSYFCEVCIKLAKAKLLQKATTISDQNPTSFSVLNESNAASDSDSPKDEYDLLVLSKKVYSDTGTPVVIQPNQTGRPATERPKPCPKRFKKPLAPIQLQTIPKTSRTADALPVPRQGPSVSESVSKVTAPPIISEVIAAESSERSSESISEEGILLDIDDTSSNHSSARDSHSPKDKYDLLVLSKKVYSDTGTPVVIQPSQTGRPATERSKPCPKRFKKPLARIPVPRQGPSVNESVSKNKSKVTAPPIISEVIAAESSERSSEPISEEGILLDIDNTSSNHSSAFVVQSQPKTTTASRLADSSKSLSSKDLPNKVTVTSSGSGSNSDKSVSQPETPLRRKNDSERSVSSSSDQQPNRTVHSHPSTFTSQRHVQIVQGFVEGPSAPPAKKPRIREDNSNLPRDLRQYFSTQTVSVNNYSRTLAG